MSCLMHLSDLHFGAHDADVCAAVQRLALRLAVDMVVVSGDVTQRATAVQFEQASRFIRSLQARSCLVLAGNHDIPLYAWWMRWGRAYERFAEQFGLQHEWVRLAGDFYVVGVDTTRAWRHERGTLSAAQIEHVARLLEKAPPGAWPIVTCHHPLVPRNADDRAHRPHRADEAVHRWQAAGARMLLSGHAHDPGLMRAAAGVWVSRAGTAVSHRLRHGSPNSLVVLTAEVSGSGATGMGRYASRWDYNPRSGEFEQVQRLVVD